MEFYLVWVLDYFDKTLAHYLLGGERRVPRVQIYICHGYAICFVRHTVKVRVTRHIGIVVDILAFQRTCHQAIALGLNTVWCDYTTLTCCAVFQ